MRFCGMVIFQILFSKSFFSVHSVEEGVVAAGL